MSGLVRIEADGEVWRVEPVGVARVRDGPPAVDVAVVEVSGGYLCWSVTDAASPPTAVLDDPVPAQDWLWSIYGEQVALALADLTVGAAEVEAEAALPELAARVRRLGLAHWAARWWPASGIDGIAPLDVALLHREIAELGAECELLLADSDPEFDVPTPTRPGSRGDYALAAGRADDTGSDGVVLARGTGGWDWRRCPPGIVDASEQAVGWTVTRETGTTLVRVSAVAAPSDVSAVAPHLRPHAQVNGATVELELRGDTWVGVLEVSAESIGSVDISVPGFGPATVADSSAAARQQVRQFAAARLRRARDGGAEPDDPPLAAEIAAAADDTDF